VPEVLRIGLAARNARKAGLLALGQDNWCRFWSTHEKICCKDKRDTIGHGYARQRRPDPRIAAQLTAALGDAQSVLNVGAGSGSYEPPDRPVVAVEPSGVMLAQRQVGAAPAVRARAEHAHAVRRRSRPQDRGDFVRQNRLYCCLELSLRPS